MSSKLTLIVRLLRSLLLKSRLVSLANSTNCAVCDDNGISFLKIKNSSGPKMDPRGTPHFVLS
jgi:hypothetical protein